MKVKSNYNLMLLPKNVRGTPALQNTRKLNLGKVFSK